MGNLSTLCYYIDPSESKHFCVFVPLMVLGSESVTVAQRFVTGLDARRISKLAELRYAELIMLM